MTADKRRIDACLKACEGISTKNLEDNVPFLELARRYNVVLRERDALRAKIEAMERQEPSHWGCIVIQSDGRWKEEVSREAPPEGYFSVRDAFPLYLAPGAQPAPSAPKVTNAMALAFHSALTDGSIGEHELEEIKVGLRAALAAAPEAKP